jgi:pimeloyl-ACP methyl ester carboxylesterase
MSARIWDDVTAALIDARRAVVVYDHRCCGESDKTFRDVSIAALGDDVRALTDHLGLERVVLNGWSLGGAVVADAAGKLGERLAGLVLTAGATPRYTRAEGFPHGGSADDVAATVAALRADRATFLHGLYYQGVFATNVSDAVKAHALNIALQASPAADGSLGALATLDQREALSCIEVPALVITGDQDAVVPPGIAESAASLLTNARLEVFEGVGHAPFIEARERYLQCLTQFLKELS